MNYKFALKGLYMKAVDYVSYLRHCREDLVEVYKNNGHPCEPVYSHVWFHSSISNRSELRPVFVHEKDKNKNTVKSLRYTFREL